MSIIIARITELLKTRSLHETLISLKESVQNNNGDILSSSLSNNSQNGFTAVISLPDAMSSHDFKNTFNIPDVKITIVEPVIIQNDYKSCDR